MVMTNSVCIEQSPWNNAVNAVGLTIWIDFRVTIPESEDPIYINPLNPKVQQNKT